MDTITYWASTGSASGMVRSVDVKLLVPTSLAPSSDGRSLLKTLMLPPEAPSWVSVTDETVAGLSPRQALGLGLKVDAESLPPRLHRQLRRGEVDLDSPATTLALLRLDAVVGVSGRFTRDGRSSLYAVPVGGGSARRLPTPQDGSDPSWSPLQR